MIPGWLLCSVIACASGTPPGGNPETKQAAAPSARVASEGVDANLDATVEIRGDVDITVEGWSKPRVEVIGGARIEGSGSRIRIRVEHRGGPDVLTVRVPVGARLDVESRVGDVEVQGVEQEVSIESTAGDVEVRGRSKIVRVASIAGDVRIGTVTERIEAKTVSGDVDVERATGEIDVKTTAGEVDIADAEATQVAISTMSGNIHFSGRFGPKRRHAIQSHSGEVELAVPPKVPVHFEVSTFSGDIDAEVGTIERQGSRRADIVIGEGGPRVELQTFSGSVMVRGR